MKLLLFEFRRLVRRPSWLALLIVAAAFFYSAEVPTFHASATDYLTALPRVPLVSIAEWARMILLHSTSIVGGLFALFVSLMLTGLLHSEAAHRDVVWSTPLVGIFRATSVRILAVGTFATAVIAVGAASAWLNPFNREMLALSGWVYIPLYLALLWLQTVVWTAGSLAIYYATHSRWLTIAAITVLAVLWFVVGLLLVGKEVPTLTLVHRSFLSWAFLGPYAPLGMVPLLLVFQAALLVGVSSLLAVISHWARRTYPAWRAVRPRLGRTAILATALLVVGCAAGSVLIIGARVAPTAFASPDPAPLPQSAVWDGNGVLLRPPSPPDVLRLPLAYPTPEWLDPAQQWNRYDNVGEIVVQRVGAIWTPKRQSLLIRESELDAYPTEYERAVRQLHRWLDPLMRHAELWQGKMNVVIVPPGAGLSRRFTAIPGTLFVADFPSRSIAPSGCAWTLTEASGTSGVERLYLFLYLLSAADPEEVEAALEALRDTIAGTYEAPKNRPWLGPMRYWDSDLGTAEASSLLEYWSRGESTGHPALAESLLEGGAR